MVLEGIVKNGVVIFDPGVQVAEGTRVRIVVPAEESRKPTLAERLLKHSGTVSGLPPDMAEQHDHYITVLPNDEDGFCGHPFL